jgi:hypothetical protein
MCRGKPTTKKCNGLLDVYKLPVKQYDIVVYGVITIGLYGQENNKNY